ncbi:MAG: four helix bundle protein [Gemmatimonadaceae bacterium]
MQNYRNLIVWQKAHTLAVRVYRVSRRLARLDRSGLASQLQRAAQSIRANIAEGSSRSSDRDFAKFLQIAIGSASEVEDHLQFARDVELLDPNDAEPVLDQVVEVRRMLYGLLKRIQDDYGDVR